MDMMPRQVRHIEGMFRARDGLELFEQHWDADHPKAAVVIVHGYAEHGSRYASVAAKLAENGYFVYASDLRGHGRSSGPRCFVDRFAEYTEDLKESVRRAGDMCPGRKIFVLAHSMGGLISAHCAVDGSFRAGGMILSAPSLILGSDFSRRKIRLTLFLDRWFPRLPTVHIDIRSLSRDENVVRMYREDPLVYHGRTPVRTAAEIIRATLDIRKRMEEVEIPFLILHGGGDRMADVKGSRELFSRSRSDDKQLEVFENFYHEVMNEPGKDVVIDKILSWLDERADTPG